MGTSLLHLQETTAGDVPWHYIQDIWGRPQDVTLGRPQDFILQRPKHVGGGRAQDVSRRRPLAQDRGPYRDVHGTPSGDVLRTSLGSNFADWAVDRAEFLNIASLLLSSAPFVSSSTPAPVIFLVPLRSMQALHKFDNIVEVVFYFYLILDC